MAKTNNIWNRQQELMKFDVYELKHNNNSNMIDDKNAKILLQRQ